MHEQREQSKGRRPRRMQSPTFVAVCCLLLLTFCCPRYFHLLLHWISPIHADLNNPAKKSDRWFDWLTDWRTLCVCQNETKWTWCCSVKRWRKRKPRGEIGTFLLNQHTFRSVCLVCSGALSKSVYVNLNLLDGYGAKISNPMMGFS